MSVDAPTDLACDIARLTASIDGAAKATEMALISGHSVSDAAGHSPLPAEGNELSRQLAALRERVALARDRRDDPRALRSELATLLFFARTLEDDADRWRAGLEERLGELERRRAAARREQERGARSTSRQASIEHRPDRRIDRGSRRWRVSKHPAHFHPGRRCHGLLRVRLLPPERVTRGETLARDAQRRSARCISQARVARNVGRGWGGACRALRLMPEARGTD
jgi:hypothetical protein